MKKLLNKKIITVLLLGIFFIFPSRLTAQVDLNCYEGGIRSTGCKVLDEGDNPCPKNYIPCSGNYCMGNCRAANEVIDTEGERGCCCEVGENESEIGIGRLMDKTEWLADEIIRESKAVVRAAEEQVGLARSLYTSSGQCRAEHCDHYCVKIPVCNSCECYGCGPDENLAAPGQCESDPETLDCTSVVAPWCAPSQSSLPKVFTETYATLVPTARAQTSCRPSPPTNLSSEVEGHKVHLSWEPGEFDYSLCESTCMCLDGGPRFLIEYRVEGATSWEQGGWQKEPRTTIEPSDPTATYEWKVAQINVKATGGAVVFSNTERFSMAPELTPGVPQNLRSEYIGDCLQRLSWEAGAHNCPSTAADCLAEPHFRVEWRLLEGGSWQVAVQDTTSTHFDFRFEHLNQIYEWRVRQYNGYDYSDWSNAAFVAESNPVPPDFRVEPAQHSVTFTREDAGDTGCNAGCLPPGCSMDQCLGSVEYIITLFTTSNAVEYLGGPTTLRSEWFSGQSYNFDCPNHPIYSDTEYEVQVSMRNGCGVQGGRRQPSFRTDSAGRCSEGGGCPPGTIPGTRGCGIYWGVNGCVNECHGYEMDPGDCISGTTGLPGCTSEAPICCAQKVACVNEELCYEAGGHRCPEEYVSCLTDCEDLGGNEICCCNFDESEVGACNIIECSEAQPYCCCDTFYWACYDETGSGCTGEPCPGDIPLLAERIEEKLHKIQTHKKNIEELYDRVKKEVPYELAVVEDKLEACFQEAGAEEAVARGELGIVRLIDCQSLLRQTQSVYTYLPEKGAYSPEEGIFLRGEQTQEDLSFGVCWGNDYCRQQVVKAEDEGLNEPDVPWHFPCAEDFYCCVWR